MRRAPQPLLLDLVFAALSDATRRWLLTRLLDGEARVGDLANPLQMSLPAVSKHLRVLEDAGLLNRRVEGRTHFITANPRPLRKAVNWIERHRQMWEGSLDKLAALVESFLTKDTIETEQTNKIMSTVIEEQTLKITRRINAPRARVFTAFTTAEAISQWFCPGPVKVLECSADFRVGGGYRIKASSPDGEKVVSGVYREITPPSKIAYTWKWEDDEDWVNVESLVTFEFKADGDETELNLTHTGFPSDESRGRHTHGWDGCFDKLDALLTGHPAPEFKPSC